VRQIALEAPTVCTVLRHPTEVLSTNGASKTVRRHGGPSRTRTQMFRDRALAGAQARQAAHQATRSEVPAAWLPILVALPRYSWHE
jgi:hypothetical protein